MSEPQIDDGVSNQSPFWKYTCLVAIGIRESIRWAVIAMTCVFFVLFVAACTVLGTPIAILFCICVCPFATVRWAFGNERWIDAWKGTVKEVGN
jgi:hypothetical protein